MPVFDQGYQPLDAPLMSRALRWWPILRQTTLPLLKRRLNLVLLAMSCGKLGIFGMLIIFKLKAGNTPLAKMLPALEPLTVVRFVSGGGYGGQWIWVAALGAVIGGGLISRDVQTGALRLYFSRPLTRVDYCLGKVGTLAVFFAAVTLLPTLLLVGFHAAATGNTIHLQLGGPTLPALLAVTSMWIVLGSLTVAALSATLGSPRLAGLAWLGYLTLGNLLSAEMIRSWPAQEWPHYLSMQRVIASLGERILLDAGAVQGFDTPPLQYDAIATWVLCLLALTCGALWARLSEVRR